MGGGLRRHRHNLPFVTTTFRDPFSGSGGDSLLSTFGKKEGISEDSVYDIAW